jgi:recombination protein RecA
MAKKEVTTVQNITNPEDKLKALETARLQIEKQFGKGSIQRLGDGANILEIDVIPTGSILLDEALGIGGYPKGRIIEIYGPESSGKTTLALHAIAESQKREGIAAFIDAEHALDPIYAKNLGVNTDSLYVSQPDSGEQALEITETLVRSGGVDIIVVDSVAALTPQAEIEGDMGDSHMGLQARLMSQALRKLTATISKSGCCLIFINQIRMKIGVMYGSPETTTGGNALKFYSSVRLEVRKTETITKGSEEDAIGNKVRVKVVKNKVAPPFRKIEMEIIFGKGISSLASLLDAAIKYNIIEKSGSWFSYGEEKIGQGRDNAKEFLEANPQLVSDIEGRLRALMFPGRTAGAASPASGAAPGAGIPRPAQAGPVSGETPVRTEAAGPGTVAAAQVAPNAAPGPAVQTAPTQTAPAQDGPGGIELKTEEPRHRGRPAGSKNRPASEDLF